MIVNIICGSPEILLEKEMLIKDNMFNIGVDRGAITLLELGIVPDFAIGDFDSITPEEFSDLQLKCSNVEVLKQEKDETDTEMAIHYAMKLEASELRLYGAIGGRLDHTLANFRLLSMIHENGMKASIRNVKNTMYLLSPGHHSFAQLQHKYLSFFANQEDVQALTLKGVKYPLQNYHLKFNDIRCISNELSGATFEVVFEKGLLLMINSCD